MSIIHSTYLDAVGVHACQMHARADSDSTCAVCKHHAPQQVALAGTHNFALTDENICALMVDVDNCADEAVGRQLLPCLRMRVCARAYACVCNESVRTKCK